MMGEGYELFELLRTTIAHAIETTDFYKSRVPASFRLRSIEDLAQLPIVSRRELTRLGEEALDRDAPPSLLGLTSGTSFQGGSSEIFYRVIGEEERAASQRMAETLWRDTAPPWPLTLRFINANHGLDFMGAMSGVFAVPLERVFHYEAAAGLLKRRFAYQDYQPRIGCLFAPLNTLKAFTLKLMADDVPGEAFDVRLVTSYAWRLTPSWRARLERYWGAEVNDVYAASEAPGLRARSCPACGSFHFSPTAHLEFLDLERDAPAEAGAPARLVVTSYYPLAVAMPILRYDTGDVFAPRGLCAASGKTSYELLGRRQDLFRFGPQGRFWGSAGMILDAIDGLEGVGRAHDARATALGFAEPTGSPRITWRVNGERAVIGIEKADSSFRGADTLAMRAHAAIAIRLGRNQASEDLTRFVEVQALPKGAAQDPGKV